MHVASQSTAVLRACIANGQFNSVGQVAAMQDAECQSEHVCWRHMCQAKYTAPCLRYCISKKHLQRLQVCACMLLHAPCPGSCTGAFAHHSTASEVPTHVTLACCCCPYCISGTLPAEYASLSNLQSFWVFSNKLKGTLPAAYSQLTALTDLQVSYNAFTGKHVGCCCCWSSIVCSC